MTDSIDCVICNLGPPKDDVAVLRINSYGERGLFACSAHRKLFPPDLKPTTECIETAFDIKQKQGRIN